LGRKFKDPVLLGLFDRILVSYQTTPGRGLPIGNLTSQHFANFYLSPLDRFLKEELGSVAYVRYMDDFVVWGGSGKRIARGLRAGAVIPGGGVEAGTESNTAINRTAFGMDFLGYRLFPGMVRLARRSKVRFARKFRRYEAAQRCGQWSELILQQRIQALLAFVMPAESRVFRRHVLLRFGVAAKRLQPCESGRQCPQLTRHILRGELEVDVGGADLVEALVRP
jgi:RNA-directed DNA polymerase